MSNNILSPFMDLIESCLWNVEDDQNSCLPYDLQQSFQRMRENSQQGGATGNGTHNAAQQQSARSGQSSGADEPVEQEPLPPEDGFEWWHKFWRDVQKSFQDDRDEVQDTAQETGHGSANDDYTSDNTSFGISSSTQAVHEVQQKHVSYVPQLNLSRLVPTGQLEVPQSSYEQGLSERSYEQPEDDAEKKRKRRWPRMWLGHKKHQIKTRPKTPRSSTHILKKTWVMSMDKQEMANELTVAQPMRPGATAL